MRQFLKHLTLTNTLARQQTVPAAEIPDSTYPTRPIRMVVGYFRTDAVETIARMVGGKLGAELGQVVLIDSSPRVGGTLGLTVAARAAPDGYTLLMTSTSTMWVARHLYNKRPVAPRGDFVPVALVGLLPAGLVVNSSLPSPDLQGHIEWLRTIGGRLDGIYAPPGTSDAIVDKLATAIRRASRTAEVRAQLVKQGVDLVLLTGPAARAFLDQEEEGRAAARA